MVQTQMLTPDRRGVVESVPSFAIESLESRQMLAAGPWVPYATLIGQDQAAAAYSYLDGSGQTVALVDRGVDYRHPQLGGGVGPTFKVVGGFNFRDNNTTILDDYGHGTGVAGIIAADPYSLNGNFNQGVAHNTKLVMLKQESSANIKQALDWIIANHTAYNIQVVNLTDFITDVVPGAWNPSVYAPELKTLHDLGIFICTPVGNGELYSLSHYGVPADITDPALSPYVMGAGGVTQSDTLWDDSRRGTGLDILGPSYNVTMPYYLQTKDAQGNGVGGYDQYDDNYTGTDVLADYAKGTSWASAYVTGTAALLKQINPNFSPDTIQQILTQTGTQVQDPENPGTYYPRLNVYAALTRGFQLIDDQYFGNTTFDTAMPLSFSKGKAALSNLKLTIGHPDNWSFDVAAKGKVTVKLTYTGTGTRPYGLVYDQNFNIVGTIGKNGLGKTLRPGKYYVYCSSATTLPSPYSLSVRGGTRVLPSASVAPQAVTAAVTSATTATPFSTTTVAAGTGTTDSTSDVLLDKTQTSVFA